MKKPDAGNARARMNRAQRRKAPKILADKVGGKKKLAAMLEDAKARARDKDAALAAAETIAPIAHMLANESDFDADGGT